MILFRVRWTTWDKDFCTCLLFYIIVKLITSIAFFALKEEIYWKLEKNKGSANFRCPKENWTHSVLHPLITDIFVILVEPHSSVMLITTGTLLGDLSITMSKNLVLHTHLLIQIIVFKQRPVSRELKSIPWSKPGNVLIWTLVLKETVELTKKILIGLIN